MPDDSRDDTTQRPDRDGPDAGVPKFSAAARYEIGEIIAKGGMGEVYTATDRQVGREVAVKRIRSERTSTRGMARFFHEAIIQGKLQHPAIVPVHEIGIDPEGRPFFVMKKLGGRTMADVIGTLPRAGLLRAFAEVCLAVAFAHDKGVVHRDLKPSNIGLGDFGEVYVLDWGIARVLDGTEDHGLAGSDDSDDRTQDGTVVGTNGYMAPEQIRSATTVDGRADVYSLGAILFEILAEERLHPRSPQVLEATLAGVDARPSARGKQVPPELESICVAATATDPAQRIAGARELATRVQAFLDGDRDVAKRKELARTHLAAARVAFEGRAEQDNRRTAIREAGRALALDPELADAADLVSRLMIEPPTQIPPDVRRMLAEEDRKTLERNARIGSRAYLAFLAFIPVLVSGGNPGYAIALSIVIATNFMLITVWRPFTKIRRVAIGCASMAMVALLARMFSPFFIAPGIAATVTMALVLSPDYDRRGSVIWLVVGMAAVILGLWVCEDVGWLSRTMELTTAHIEFDGPATGIPARPALIGLVMYVIALVAAAAFIGQAVRRAERAARAHLHLQAWQLSQLVPTQ